MWADARPFTNPKRERTINRIREFHNFSLPGLLVLVLVLELDYEEEEEDEDEEDRQRKNMKFP